MFQGETAITVDDKGRLTIPTSYRDQVADVCKNRLVVTYNPFETGCLWIFPYEEWERVRDDVNKLPSVKAVHRNLQMKLVGAPPSSSPTVRHASSCRQANVRRRGLRKKPCCSAWVASSSFGANRPTSRRSARRSPRMKSATTWRICGCNEHS